jgi:hypothetical protein
MDRGARVGRGKGYVMTSVTAERSARKVGGGGESESQDDLTGRPWGNSVLVAKVDTRDMA